MEPQPKVDPIGHKDRKKGLGVGHNHPRAYRRDAGYSIYLGFFVLFVAINSSRRASIFEDSNTEKDFGIRSRRVWIHLVGETRDCIYSDATLRAPPAGLCGLCTTMFSSRRRPRGFFQQLEQKLTGGNRTESYQPVDRCGLLHKETKVTKTHSSLTSCASFSWLSSVQKSGPGILRGFR